MAEMCVKAVLAVADLERKDVNLDLIKARPAYPMRLNHFHVPQTFPRVHACQRAFIRIMARLLSQLTWVKTGLPGARLRNHHYMSSKQRSIASHPCLLDACRCCVAGCKQAGCSRGHASSMPTAPTIIRQGAQAL